MHAWTHKWMECKRLGLLVAWWATNAKQVSTAFGENVCSLGLFAAGGLPTLSFFTLLPLVGVLIGSACLAAWLVVCLDLVCLLFALVAWFVGCLVGLLVWPRCCLVGWSVGWRSGDGCVDGWVLCKWGGRSTSPAMQKSSLPRAGFLVSTALGENTELCGLVAWFVGCFVGCWFGHVVAWLVGRLVGTPLMDGCTDGWMDPALPHVPEASGSVSGGSRRSGQCLRSFRRVPKG